ncbi:MAG: peptidase T [Alphaproteobacteria bacterium]
MKKFTDPQEILDRTNLVKMFTEIVQVGTQADETSDSWPSTSGQLKLQNILKEKLGDLGCTDIVLDENGYLFATFPGNVNDAPVIGLLAHVDTATDFSGQNIKPIMHENYDGSAITLENDVVISPEESPELKECVGDTIITADGTTLLGADDKAGVAAIMAALEILKADDSIQRPTLRIGFTPDEEIGRGAERFDVERFNATAAYTLDGGWAGEVNAETFCADGAKVVFKGVAVHPGYAKDKMVNAMRYAAKFIERLPQDEAPETTEKRQGFFHPLKIEGNAAEVTINLILRDFEEEDLIDRGKRLKKIVEEVAKEEPRLQTEVEIKFSYRNMAQWLRKQPEITDRLMQAVRDTGLEANMKPVRGGTDGSGLTAKGLPTPNVFAGGINFHGPREWISTRVMGLAVCTVLNLVQNWTE